MKVSLRGRRAQAGRVYKYWSVKFLKTMYPKQYATNGKKEFQWIVMQNRISLSGSNVWYDRQWSE